jgi:hypothetical protein
MRALGYRRAENYYNREASDGLIQVVGFQSGQAVSMFHGNFTVNLGVYVPCIARFEGNVPRGRYVTDAFCDIRSRLSEVAGIGSDRWWPLDDSAPSAGMEIARALLDHGAPFLEKYSSYDSIIAEYNRNGTLPFCNPARSALAAAIIYWARGEVDQARKLFVAAQTMPSHNIHFASYAASVQSQCGI